MTVHSASSLRPITMVTRIWMEHHLHEEISRQILFAFWAIDFLNFPFFTSWTSKSWRLTATETR